MCHTDVPLSPPPPPPLSSSSSTCISPTSSTRNRFPFTGRTYCKPLEQIMHAAGGQGKKQRQIERERGGERKGDTTRKVVQAQSTKCQIQAPATISAWHVVAALLSSSPSPPSPSTSFDLAASSQALLPLKPPRFVQLIPYSLFVIPITRHTHTHTYISRYSYATRTCNTNKLDERIGQTFICNFSAEFAAL